RDQSVGLDVQMPGVERGQDRGPAGKRSSQGPETARGDVHDIRAEALELFGQRSAHGRGEAVRPERTATNKRRDKASRFAEWAVGRVRQKAQLVGRGGRRRLILPPERQ